MQNKNIDQILTTIDGADVQDEHYWSDKAAAIEGSALAELEEDVSCGFISAEDCEAMYASWLKKYRHPRPEFHT